MVVLCQLVEDVVGVGAGLHDGDGDLPQARLDRGEGAAVAGEDHEPLRFGFGHDDRLEHAACADRLDEGRVGGGVAADVLLQHEAAGVDVHRGVMVDAHRRPRLI